MKMEYICTIDRALYSGVSDNIITDEVVLTQNQKDHILERRKDDYQNYGSLLADIITDPDYIFRDPKKDNTAIVIKALKGSTNNINIILKLAVEGDNPNYKNSIITMYQLSEKKLGQLVRNRDVLYKKD